MDLSRLLPRYWIQNYPTNMEWDAMLNDLMDRYPPTDRGDYTVTFGPVEVWIENWPYAYGRIDRPTHVDLLPTVKTRKRLRRLVGRKSEACKLPPIKRLIDAEQGVSK